jgi:glutamate carboxypeptidase
VKGDLRENVVVDLERLVSTESPSTDREALLRCAEVTADIGEKWIGVRPAVVMSEGHPNLVWRFGERSDVLLLGHFDTVWPLHTIDRWPFSVDGDRATGPGVFDMKAGIVQMFVALSQMRSLDGISILLTSDEEIGSAASRALIERMASETKAVLVLEASLGGALKTVRKGASYYETGFHGRAAHAGLDPESGINAILAMAEWVLAASALAAPEFGTTVSVTLAGGGSAQNTIPMHATATVDVRVRTAAEQDRVDSAIRAIPVSVEGIRIVVDGGPNRPPLEAVRSERLFARAQEAATILGLEPVRGASVGGCSDGNLTAGIGIDTLDGLGAVGEHAHAEGEWASVHHIIDRAFLVRGILDRLANAQASV